MPQAPTLEQNVFPEQGPLPNAGGADFGAQVGEAQQGLGQAVSGVGDVAFKHVMQIQGLKNEATASDMDVQFQGDLGTLEDNYYSLKGKAAADAYPQFQSDLTALRSKYLTAAPNPMVQNMLQQSVGYSVGRSLRSAGQHAGQETKSWMIDAQKSRFDSLGYAATKRFNDQGYADETDTARDAAIDNLGEIQGWSADHIALAKQQGRDELLANRQKAALDYAKGQPVADVVHSLVGTTGADSQSGPVGGQAYRAAVVATEFGSGQNDPNNPHQGPVQADDAWWARFGRGGDRNNTQDALKALDLETSVNLPQLKEKLGRPVTDADLYLAHQQGLAGATAILTHPDAPASESVPLANIAANLPAGSGDPSTITGAQFANIWSKGFDQSGGIMANNPASKNNQLDAAISVLSDAQKQELTRTTLSAWHTQDAAVREQTRFQQQQADIAQKAQLDHDVGSVNAALAKSIEDPTQQAPNLLKIAQLPEFVDHPEAMAKILAYSKALHSPDGVAGISAANTSAMFGKLFPSDGSAPLTKNDIDDAFVNQDPAVHINKGDHDWLVGQLNGAKDPTAKRLNGQANGVFDVVKRQIDPSIVGTMGTDTHSPFSGTRMLQYKQAVAERIAQFKAAGKDPAVLFDPSPGNKDYVGSAGFTAPYTRSLTDLMTEEATGQESAPEAPAGGSGGASAGAPEAPPPMPGTAHLDPNVAPIVPAGAPRPMGMGEYVANPDGSTSNEITLTVTNPQLNGGKATVIPSLWVINGQAVKAPDEDTAARWAAQSGLEFKSFGSIKEADKFAEDREANWQKIKPEDAGKVEPLWKQKDPGYKTLADIQTAINNHEMTLAQAQAYAVAHGLARAAAPASGGPTVPLAP